MARWTWQPEGRPQKVFEIVLTDDDPRERNHSDARTLPITRLFTRGDLDVPIAAYDVMITTGAGAQRAITKSLRLGRQHLEVDLSASGITVTFPQKQADRDNRTWDYFHGPARGQAPPADGSSFDTYIAKSINEGGGR